MSHIPSSFFKPSPVIPGLFIVIPGLIRDLLLAPHEMLNQVQHDSLEKPVILQKVVIPTRIKKRSKPGLQSDSGPQRLTRVSVIQSDPFVSSRA